MTYIQVKTLTPIHVGSGRQFQGNMEYLYFPSEKKVAIVDERKALSIIGTENIQQWIGIINRRDSLLDYLRQRSPTLQPTQVASRVLSVIASSPASQDTLKEQIHSGNGQPILPGSSLKGAIRTAYFALEVQNDPSSLSKPDILRRHRYDKKSKQRVVGNKNKLVDEELQYHLIGRDPNHDYFRLLRIGDIHFQDTICLLMQSLNETRQGYEIKNGVSQFVECIPAHQMALGRIQVPEQLRDRIMEKRWMPEKVRERFSVEELVRIVNQHTRRIVEEEISTWEKRVLPEPMAAYPEQLQSILHEIEACHPHEFVLRLGQGSGYRFTTGDWQSLLPDFWQKKIKDNLQKPYHREFEFPKSRRLGEGGIPMGFIKLTLLNDAEYQQAIARVAQQEEERMHQAQIVAQQEAQAAEERQQRQLAEAEAARQAEEAARQPQYFTGRVKAGHILDAYCLGADPRNSKQKQFQLYVGQPGGEQVVNLTYQSDLDTDIVHQVRVKSASKKGKVDAIEYIGPK